MPAFRYHPALAYHRMAGVLMAIMSLSWVVRVFLLGPAPEAMAAPIPHPYAAALMVPILSIHLAGLQTMNLSTRKWATLCMAALWIMVAMATAFVGTWQPIYFGFVTCYVLLFLSLARVRHPVRDAKDDA